MSLNDEDLGLQIASNDDESRSWTELIEPLETGLSQQEQTVVRHLKTVELPHPQARRFLLAEVEESISTRPGWKLQHYAAEIGMTVEEFFQVIGATGRNAVPWLPGLCWLRWKTSRSSSMITEALRRLFEESTS